MLTIELPAEVENRLQALVQSTGRSATFYIREAILEHLDYLEDIYLAQQRLESLRAGSTQAIPVEELMAHYGVEN